MLELLVVLLPSVVQSWYSSASPAAYLPGDSVSIESSYLKSPETQLPFAFDYLNYCERLPSIEFRQNKPCQVLCTRGSSPQNITDFEWFIDEDYVASWSIDHIPAGVRMSVGYLHHQGVRANFYQDGFPLGHFSKGAYYVYNHWNLFIQIHEANPGQWRIVGFLVEPLSLHQSPGSLQCKSKAFANYLDFSRGLEEHDLTHQDYEYMQGFNAVEHIEPQALNDLHNVTTYTYSVFFEETDVAWTERWDQYLTGLGHNAKLHWLAMINSFGVILLLSAIVGHIFGQVLKRDLFIFSETYPEERGWKRLSRYVFHPPSHPLCFAALIGVGTQTMLTVFGILILVGLGLITEDRRNDAVFWSLVMYLLMGGIGGYVSARLYKSFGGERMTFLPILQTVILPGVVIVLLVLEEVLLAAEGSLSLFNGSCPNKLFLIWLCVSYPIVLVGAGFGLWQSPLQNPGSTARLPQPVNRKQSRSFRLLTFAAGSVPFACVFIEFNYFMQSVWHHQLFSYLFLFLVLTLVVLTITSAEVSILMTYLLLNRQDHRWWWQSFWIPASSAVYLLIYSAFFELFELNLTRLSSLYIFFTDMTILAAYFALFTGTIGSLSSYLFTRKIYSLIKAD